MSRPAASPLVRRAHAVLIAATVLAAACVNDATAPAPGAEAGRYVLATLDGRPVPAAFDTSSEEFGVLLADTIELDGHGNVARGTSVRRVSVRYGVSTGGGRSIMRYRLDGRVIDIGSFTPCPPNALCTGYESGELFTDRIRLARSFYGDAVYRREP